MNSYFKNMTGRLRTAGWISVLLLAVAVCVLLVGCGQTKSAQDSRDISAELVYESSLETEYAEEFSADFYEGGYTLLTIADGSRFLLVPDGKKAPEDLAPDVTVLQQPLSNIYLVASAAMSSFQGQGRATGI